MHRPIISQDQKRERGTGSDNYKASVSPRQEPPAGDRKAYNGFQCASKPELKPDARHDPRHDQQFVPS